MQLLTAQLDDDAGCVIGENKDFSQLGNAARNHRSAAGIRPKFHRVRGSHPRDHHVRTVPDLHFAAQRPDLNGAGIPHGDHGARAGRSRRHL